MNLPFRDRAHAELEQRLRAGARAFAPEPSPALHGRILAALRDEPRPPGLLLPRAAESCRPSTPTARERAGVWIAAAAALFVLGSAWWLTRRSGVPAARATAVVTISRGLLDAGSRMLALPGQAEGSLRLEAEKLLADTTRVADGVVRGLPAPLRARFERM